MQNTVRQDAFVFTDTHDDRILHAVGSGVTQLDEDFTGTPVASNAPAGWTATLVGSSTAALAAAVGGTLLITTGASENDGVTLQGPGLFTPGSSASLCLYARLKVSEATQSDLFVGLSVTDTAPLTNLGKRIGFRSVDGSASVALDVEGDTEVTVAGITVLVDDTYIELEAYWDASSGVLRYYVDGALKGTLALTNIPDDAVLRPTIQYLSGSAGAKTATVDRLRVVQIGGR